MNPVQFTWTSEVEADWVYSQAWFGSRTPSDALRASMLGGSVQKLKTHVSCSVVSPFVFAARGQEVSIGQPWPTKEAGRGCGVAHQLAPDRTALCFGFPKCCK